MDSIKKFCKCCKKHLSKGYFKRHLKTKKHKTNEQIQKENEKIKNDVVTFPKELIDIILDYKEDLEQNSEIHELTESINKAIEKKNKTKSYRIYSRDIKFRKKIKCSIVRDIFAANILPQVFIFYLDENTFCQFDENEITNGLSLQYTPIRSGELMVMFH